MFKRRVQAIGDTFIISIPKEWARLHNLKRQDEVLLETLPDLSLMIIPPSKSTKQVRTHSIELELVGDLKYDLMNAISRYLVGYDEFYLKANLANQDYLKLFIKELTSKVLGLEIVSFEESSAVVKNVAGDFSLNVNEVVERLFKILDSTMRDLLAAIKSENPSESKLAELVEKDGLADKLTMYSLRVLNKILLGEYLPREYGFSSFLEANITHDVLRDLERSIDHIAYIAQSMLGSQMKFADEDRALVISHFEKLIEFSSVVRGAVEEFQHEQVHTVISAKYNELMSIEGEYANAIKKNPNMHLMLDNLRRVKAYLFDIVELMMDKSATLTKVPGASKK